MKKLIFISIELLPTLLLAQTNFEGIITYRMHSSYNNTAYYVKTFYGKNKIKMIMIKPAFESNDKIDDGNDIVLYDFEKGLEYSIDTKNEAMEIDSLKYPNYRDPGTNFIPLDSFKTIANYKSRLYKTNMSNKDSLMNQSKGLQIWFAEDIKYIVAKEYHNKRSILANIEGNCIWLEFSHVSSSGWSTVTNGPISDTFSTKVISIEPKELPDDVFELPANYSLSYKEPDIMSAVDEALEPIETEPIKVEKESKPSEQPKPSTPSKTPAKKTKGTKPVKG